MARKVIPWNDTTKKQADADCVAADESGRTLYLFSVDYLHMGRTYSVDIWAKSMVEAEAHVRSMKVSAKYKGQIVSRDA